MKKNRKILLFTFLLIFSVFFTACSNKEATNTNKEATNKETAQADFKVISMEDLQKNIGQEDWVVVDTRSNDAFNGWTLEGEKRGGHIKGAVDFSAAWLDAKIDKK